MIGQIIPFPHELSRLPAPSDQTGTQAHIIIMPVIRIERWDGPGRVRRGIMPEFEAVRDSFAALFEVLDEDMPVTPTR